MRERFSTRCVVHSVRFTDRIYDYMLDDCHISSVGGKATSDSISALSAELLHYSVTLKRWLQLTFDCDSTAVRLFMIRHTVDWITVT